MADGRKIELDVEVPGTSEQVWQAVATGPGIGSWYVPHTVEERPGGAMTASFGPGMDVSGRVAAWEPPNRVMFDNGEGVGGMAFEWLVEATDRGTCIVRLINSGFDDGDEWDDQFDAMTNGWGIFLRHLGLYLEHFSGQFAEAALPMASWAGSGDQTWLRLTKALGLPVDLAAGDTFETTSGPTLSGSVVGSGSCQLTLLLDQPARGSAFVVADEQGESTQVSVWAYFYGDDAVAQAQAHTESWGTFLSEIAPTAPPES